MSEEYTHETIETVEPAFTSFVPLTILLAGLIIWTGYQVFAINSQRSVYSQQFQQAVPSITQAQNIQDRYVKLMKDLYDTSAKDPNAAQIIKEAQQAGLIRIAPPAAGAADASGTTTPTPAPDASAAPAK